MKKDNSINRKIKYSLMVAVTCTLMGSFVSGCGSSDSPAPSTSSQATESAPQTQPAQDTSSDTSSETSSEEKTKGSRDNTPVCLVPEASGETVYENEYACIDASHADAGYIIVRYTGECPKVKLQITGPDQNTYTYDLATGTPKDEVFSLQSGSGDYMVNVFENVEGTQYIQALSQQISASISDEFAPFLYPNQYVYFTPSSKCVAQGEELAYSCNSDLDVITEVYNYIINNITYDHEMAETVQSGYIPDPDTTLASKTGICLDYSSLMVAMLRSQQIPTRMEIGYAGTAYHAWLSAYIKDVGWVNGVVEFDGKDWSLMDPTFASNINEEKLKSYIGDGSKYSVQYIY